MQTDESERRADYDKFKREDEERGTEITEEWSRRDEEEGAQGETGCPPQKLC